MLRILLLLSVGTWLWSRPLSSVAQPAFNTIITDQPSFESQISEAAGLSDGGFVAVGSSLIQADEPLSPIRAVMAARYDVEGTIIWARAYPEPRFSEDNSARTVQLALVGDTVYLLVAEEPTPGSRINLLLRRIDPDTGEELYRLPLGSGDPLSVFGLPRDFAVVDDAAVVVRESRGGFRPDADHAVQVFGLDDGLLRAEIVKPAGYDDEATAWPAAGLVVVDNAPRQLAVAATGDTTSLALGDVPHPESDVLMFLANGKRAVYVAGGQRDTAAFVLATADGGNVTTTIRSLPPELDARLVLDLTAWGPDSFAVTVYGTRARYIADVHVFSMDGNYGRLLPGVADVVHHYIDGPKHGFLREQPAAPKQRRLLYRSFFSSDPLGVVDYVSGDTLALPPRIASPNPALLDNLGAVTLTTAGELLGIRVTGEATGDWFKFDDRGVEIPLSPRKSLAPLQFFSPRLTTFGDGRGYAVHNCGNWDFLTRVAVVDERLDQRDLLQLAPGRASIVGAARQPDGGIVYALKQTDTLLLKHVSSRGVVSEYGTFPPNTFGGGNPFVGGFAVGPRGEVALVGLTRVSLGVDKGFLIERGPGRNPRLRGVTLDPAFSYQVNWGSDGSLLVTNLRSDYWHYRLQSDGTFGVARAGRFVDDDVRSTGVKLLDENQVVLSYNLVPNGRPSRALLGRYDLATQELTHLHESAPVSYARRLELTADGRVLQEIGFNTGYTAVVVSQGSVSPTRELVRLSDSPLAIRSPFTNTLAFSLDDNSDPGNRTPAVLYDMAGREVFKGLPDAREGHEYGLALPRDLPPGVYTLRFGPSGGICVKQ